MNSLKKKFHLAGIKEILLPRSKNGDSPVTSAPARALFGATPERAGKRRRELVDFLKEVALFEDLQQGDLKWLARIVHERNYRDGEIIFEQGTPGAALYLLRGGLVEITRKKRNGEEIPLVVLEPPASFEELAGAGTGVVHWASARARGPVSLVAMGRSDLDALSRNFPFPANKILMKLAQFVAVQLQSLLEAEYFNEESEP